MPVVGLLLLTQLVMLTSDVEPVRCNIVPAIYMFGDSTADVGNNNQLPGAGVPRANHSPYGIDYPGGTATGRFCNGYVGVDYMAMLMGFKESPPAYLYTVNDTSKQADGVNFASAGSGVLDTTRPNTTISMNEQVMDFEKTKEILTQAKGKLKTKLFLSKSIFLLSTANNDLFAFYQTYGSSPNTTQNNVFISSLAGQFKDQIKRIYDLGGRKFVVFGTGRLGCLPAVRVLTPNHSCFEDLNNLSKLFNVVMRLELRHLMRSRCPGMKVSYINFYGIDLAVNSSPQKYGFKVLDAACCGSGVLNAEGPCLPNSTYCANRNEYIYWDSGHPTQAYYEVIANFTFYGSRSFASPINLQKLISI